MRHFLSSWELMIKYGAFLPFDNLAIRQVERNYGQLFVFSGPYVHMHAITKELRLEGFIVTRFKNKFPTAIEEMKEWINEVCWLTFGEGYVFWGCKR